ncbi:phospholipase effector Tle1 domain-containing protein [Pseudoduganella lutea]|nr:DUF2235 domain-containing protein [Pseudoduganella lutea]
MLHGLLLALPLLLSGCASMNGEDAQPPAVEQPLAGEPGQPKRIMVFLDGTRNDAGSGTNVRKLFDAVVAAKDPQTTSLYIEGVGSAETPLLGSGLGFGMEPRILRGYDFIAQAYRPGDEVFLFGFSRGAHSARALAGLLAYAGVPPAAMDDRAARLKRHNRIIEIVKGKNDRDFESAWRAWRPGAEPVVAKEVGTRLAIVTIPVEIAFLGVWDTVPGSAFKTFGNCRELADRRDGDRYKSDSYPPIRRIFHAVSLDEKRSKFRPLLLCPALAPAHTELGEVWFPGAHADIGGGYEDAQGLSNISLQWMVAKLGAHYAPRLTTLSEPSFAADPLGIAHWSIGDRPANLLSDCEDRRPPPGAVSDPAVAARIAAGTARVRMHGVIESKPYPLSCSGK